MDIKDIVRDCIKEHSTDEKNRGEKIEACVVGKVRKEQALESLENAVQAVGKWSEETDNKMVKRLVPEYVERIDDIGEEIKELKY